MKLSELLTGDPKTWRRVRLNEWHELSWIAFKFIAPSGAFVGYDSEGNPAFYDNLSGSDDWEYYEESKPSYEKSKIPFPACYLKEDNSIAHVFIDENLSCQCGVQKRLSGRISFMNAVDAKPKVTRWLWAVKSSIDGRWLLVESFYSEGEAARSLDTWKARIKLPWTQTEFDE